MSATIPLVDLKAQYAAIGPAVDQAIQQVLDIHQLHHGSRSQGLRAAFAAYCGANHCVGVASGTAALELVLRALGMGPGDEVITVAHTFIATAEAISAVGALPVFVDIDPTTYNMAPDALAAALDFRHPCHHPCSYLWPAGRHGRDPRTGGAPPDSR